MANFVKWTTVTSPQRAYSQRYLGHQLTYLVDLDASSANGTWTVAVDQTAYQFASGVTPQDLNFYYFTGTHGSPVYWDSDPYYRQRLYVNNTNGALGTPVRWTAGTFTAGQTLSDYYFCGNNLGGTWYYSEYSSLPTVPSAPAQAASCSATRNSDSQATVTWDTTPAGSANIMRVRRYVDGSTLSNTWTYDGSANFISTLVDTGISAGHAYTYDVAYGYYPSTELRDAGFICWADAEASSAIYTSPLAPTSISGARIAASTVRVTLSNPATTATGLEVQASTDPADWSGAISQTASGSPVTTVDVTGISGIYYFRARNTRGALVSAWSPISDAVVTLVPPNPPTLNSPANGSVHNYTNANSATLSWTHNPIDGSAQSAAQIGWSTDGGVTWSTDTVSTATTYVLSLSSYVGDTVTWRVRTKGADPNYGNWSSTRTFTVYPAPTVSITLEDANGVDVTGGSLSDMPLTYIITATDGYTTPSSGTVSIAGYSEELDTGTMTGTIDPSEIELANGVTYTFTASVSMASSISATATATVTTAFADPQEGALAASEADGIMTVTVGLEPIGAGEVAASSISLYRVTDGTSVLIASGLSAGDTLTDRYAPLNRDFTYRVVTYSSAGASRGTDFPQRITSSKWYVMTANATAWGEWNPAGSLQFARPEKTRVQYVGRTYPVSYDGSALSDSRTSSWQLLTLDERDRFIAVMADGGRGVYKSCDGDVFKADFDLRFSANYTSGGRYGTATLTINRIESEAL